MVSWGEEREERDRLGMCRGKLLGRDFEARDAGLPLGFWSLWLGLSFLCVFGSWRGC